MVEHRGREGGEVGDKDTQVSVKVLQRKMTDWITVVQKTVRSSIGKHVPPTDKPPATFKRRWQISTTTRRLFDRMVKMGYFALTFASREKVIAPHEGGIRDHH